MVFVALVCMSAKKAESEKLVMCGSGWKKIAIVDKATKSIEWEYPVEDGWECNSVASLGKGKILFSYKKGARVVDKNKKTVWDMPIPTDRKCELQAASFLDNGNCLLAWGGHPLTILEVNAKTGKEISRTEYETGVKSTHSQIRQINKDDEGNYIVPVMTNRVILIISADGKLVREINVDGRVFGIEKLANGNYMVSCGDGHMMKEVNLKTGEIVRTIGATDIEGTSLFYVAGMATTAKGNMYICNWQGHSKGAIGPQIIEVNPDLEMVWNIEDKENFAKISGIDIVKK